MSRLQQGVIGSEDAESTPALLRFLPILRGEEKRRMRKVKDLDLFLDGRRP